MTNEKLEEYKKIIEESGLFDSKYYVRTYKDARRAEETPLEHFVKYGLEKDRKPNAEFDPLWYKEQYSDIAVSGVYPFIHYITYGKDEGRLPSPQDKSALKEENQLQEESKLDIEHFSELRSVVAQGFDAEFYMMQVGYLEYGNALDDYLLRGWKMGVDPNPDFSVSLYFKNNPEIKEAEQEPFYHFLAYGRMEGRHSYMSLWPAKELTQAEEAVKDYFDVLYYLETYPDIKQAKINPLVHYMRSGWREGRNPSKDFSTIHYILNNLDIVTAQINPLYHYVAHRAGTPLPNFSEIDTIKKFLGHKIYHAMQDITFPNVLSKAEKVFIIVIPEHNEMSGGIFSMFSIANVVRRLKSEHGYEVVLMTRPTPQDVTYCRQKNFPNSEDIFRFEQVERLANVKEIYLHLPEYTAPDFVENLKPGTLSFLKSVETVHVNILNQNYELMPEEHEFQKLRETFGELTQSVAHHSYYGQSFADRYNLPTLLLPAYTDLSAYTPSSVEHKSNLIIYSLDEAPHKEEVIAKIKKELPQYELFEIKNITFDHYMELATKCKYSISFGEGFDGYVAQPIYQGGIGMTVYNEEYFPSEEFLQYKNFFESEEDMIDNIVNVIKSLDKNDKKYTELNKALVAEWNKLYSYDEYVEQIRKLVNREFELFPGSFSENTMSKAYKTGLSSTIKPKG